MKKIPIIFIFIITTFLFISSKSFAQEGDVNVRIPESSLTESIQVLLDTKAFNIAAYNGIGWLGWRTIHVNMNSVTVNLTQSAPGQPNMDLLFNATARAGLQLFGITFNVSVTGSFRLYGTVNIDNEKDGYNVYLHVMGMRDFSVTNTILDAFLTDILWNIVSQFSMISFHPELQILPSIPAQYFTSPNPRVTVTNDEIILSLDVNELYLANDTISGSKSYESSYIEAGQDYLVAPNGNLMLNSGTKGIKLIPGFHADYGSDFQTSVNPLLDNLYSDNALKNFPIQDDLNKLYVVLDTLKTDKNPGDIKNIPDKFNLYQNFPNPFNPVTNIRFDLPSTGKVKLIIYDIMGREIAKLADSEFNPGKYQYNFDGSLLSSGTYFYKLETPGFVSIKKMLLIK